MRTDLVEKRTVPCLVAPTNMTAFTAALNRACAFLLGSAPAPLPLGEEEALALALEDLWIHLCLRSR